MSDAIRNMLAPDIKVKSKLTTVHSGIDINKFNSFKSSNYLRSFYDLPKETFLIGNTSALADHKDYFTFIDTAEMVLSNRNDVHFFIMGDGPLKQEIEEYIKGKNLEQHITMTGFLSNIEEALSSLDLFLFTSKTEGLGTSVLDAMGAGVPIVATKAGGVPEMIESEKNGLLSNPKDAHALANQVLTLMNDSTLSASFVKASKEKVNSFSKEHTAEKTIEIYRELVG